MTTERDRFREYVEFLENRRWRCKFCKKEFGGSNPRILAHLAGIPGHGIKACEKVKDPVRAEAIRVFNICTRGTSGTGTEGTPLNRRLDAAHGNENASSFQQLPMDLQASPSFDFSKLQAVFEILNDEVLGNSRPTGTGTAPACPQDQVPLPPGDMPLDNLDNTQQSNPSNHQLDSSHGKQLLIDWSASSPLDQSERSCGHVEFGGGIAPGILLDSTENSDIESPFKSLDEGANASEEIGLQEFTGGDVLLTPLLINTTTTSIPQFSNEQYLSFDEQFAGEITKGTLLYPTENFDMEENSLKSGEEGANTSEELETVHNPTPMNIDPSTASQQLEASTNTVGPSSANASAPPQLQTVPHGCINLTTMHQNPTLASSSSKKQSVTCHPQALMDKDSCMPSSSQAPNNAPPPPQILPCGTGLIGPSSIPELDTNEGVPMTSHPNTRNNFEENGALKRKLAILYSKEAELKFAAPLFLKKQRKEVAKWLADVEKLRIDCPAAASEDCLPPYQQVDILMHEAEELSRQGKGLFEAREVTKLLEDKMVGEAFQINTTKILKFLAGNQISRLGIYGMGGVGKTAIMLRIHNRILEEENYGDVLWITVSRNFKTRKLQDTIWEELGLGKLQEEDVRKRAAMLCDRLTKRGKLTIILDDVWKCIDLTEVGIPVEVDGIKLVLTTRLSDICDKMQCKMIKIEPLSDIEAESLFLEKLQFEGALNVEIKAVVMSVIKKCAGLPLAIVTIARSMRGVTNMFEWNDCWEKLKESDTGRTDMEKVLKKLKISYDRLGDHEYQQCFLSCALYPEDWLIDKLELIEFFIDQGLIGRLNTRKKQYDRGLTILQKLVNACLLEDHESKVKMHDLIRDMALYVMSAVSIVKAGKGLRRIPSKEYWTDALEKVSLMENEIREFPLNMSPYCPKLSIFLLNANLLKNVVIPDSFFKHLLGLKVLDLSACVLKELPDSISDLVNLTALLLGGCDELRCIPHLGKLESLRKLDICGCRCVNALEGLEMLVNLRYLDITITCIERSPKGTLGALLNLQCLRAGLVNVEEITELQALETLECCFDNVHDFNKFVSKRGNNPLYYNIRLHQDGFQTFYKIDVGVLFQDRTRSVDITVQSHAFVSARGESSGRGRGRGRGICILIPQDVRNLRAWSFDGATNLSDVGLLEELEELEIACWSNLRVLCGGQGEEVIDIHDSPTRTPTPVLFRSLRDLNIIECPKLKYLFGHEPKFSLPHLRRIRIWDCVEIVGITVVATSPPPYPPPAFPKLEEIEVWRCDKMKRVVESEWLPHFPKLRRIDVHNCKNMEGIIGGLSSYMSVEEISLERPLVKGCHELPLHLRNLQTIRVQGCEGMVELISGAGQGQEGSMTTPVNNTSSSSQSSISLPKLNYLVLEDLPQLKSICEVLITCNSMGYLKVIGCPELNRIPLEMQLRDIKDLPYIELEGEEKWKTLIWDHPNAQANLQSHLVFEGSCCILDGRRNSRSSAKK